jgi:prepilin peptidase CpaA
MSVQHALLIAAVTACAVGALIDLRTGSIPNWLTLGLLAIAPLVRGGAALLQHQSLSAGAMAALWSVAGAGLSALLPALLWRGGGLGLGDVKLFAAIGASCGAFVGLYAQSYAYVVAMVYAIVLVVRRKKLASTLANLRRLLSPTGRRGADPSQGAPRHEGFTEFRFGPAILAGMCIAAWAQWRS